MEVGVGDGECTNVKDGEIEVGMCTEEGEEEESGEVKKEEEEEEEEVAALVLVGKVCSSPKNWTSPR